MQDWHRRHRDAATGSNWNVELPPILKKLENGCRWMNGQNMNAYRVVHDKAGVAGAVPVSVIVDDFRYEWKFQRRARPPEERPLRTLHATIMLSRMRTVPMGRVERHSNRFTYLSELQKNLNEHRQIYHSIQPVDITGTATSLTGSKVHCHYYASILQ